MLPAGAKLIDLRSLAVVDAPSTARFVALSYMWPTGGQDHAARLERANMALLSTPRGLNNVQLPPIVSSAVCLAKNLDESYLWIDRFCIIQDDPDSKQIQINAMARIYEAAAFTIIAALDSRDGHSLPGIDCPRKSHWGWPPHDVEIEGASVKPEVMLSVERSLWNTRGWTFQESKLSARKLFITELHVAFECPRGIAYEEYNHYTCNSPVEPRLPTSLCQESSTEPDESEAGINQESQETWQLEQSLIPGFERRYSGGDALPSDSTLYWKWAGEYTSREFADGGDILNAFAGVSDRMGRILDCRFFFNVPEKYFAQGLRWNAIGPARKRYEVPSIPSWSWASCKNGIDFGWPERSAAPRAFLKESALQDIVSLVRFNIMDRTSGLQAVRCEERWLHEELALEEFRQQETIPRSSYNFNPPHHISHQIWSLICPHNPWTTLEYLALDEKICEKAISFPGALVFNTTMAKLSVRDDGDNEGPGIFGPTGNLAGRVPGLDRTIYEHGGDRLFDFVVICGGLENWRSRRSLYKLSTMMIGNEQATDALRWDMYKSWRLFVLLVERDVDKDYLFRRIHAGYIYAARWKMCQPNWQTVVLI